MTSPAWKRLHDISAEEGLVALAYERKHHQWRWVGGASVMSFVILNGVGQNLINVQKNDNIIM